MDNVLPPSDIGWREFVTHLRAAAEVRAHTAPADAEAQRLFIFEIVVSTYVLLLREKAFSDNPIAKQGLLPLLEALGEVERGVPSHLLQVKRSPAQGRAPRSVKYSRTKGHAVRAFQELLAAGVDRAEAGQRVVSAVRAGACEGQEDHRAGSYNRWLKDLSRASKTYDTFTPAFFFSQNLPSDSGDGPMKRAERLIAALSVGFGYR